MIRIFNRLISKWKIFLLAGDLAMYCLAVMISLFFNPKIPQVWAFLTSYLWAFVAIFPVYIAVFCVVDLYDYQQDFRLLRNYAKVGFSSFLGTLAVIILFYFPLGVFVGRIWLVIYSLVFTGFLILWRITFSALAIPQRLQQRVLIIGAGKCGQDLLCALRKRPHSGLKAVGFVDDDPRKIGKMVAKLLVLGDSSRLPELIKKHQVSLAVVAVTHEKSQTLINALTKICWNGCQVMDMPSMFEVIAGRVPLEHISDVWIYLSSLQSNKPYYRHVKRLMDIVLSALGMAMVLPLFPFIILAIKFDSAGPVFFRQERLGREGKPFQILKFRTMRQDAESSGPQWARVNDARITRVGRILRRLRYDELPQLINILKGEMSFIGPRPERETFIREFEETMPVWRRSGAGRHLTSAMVCEYRERVPYYSYRLLVKPGLTGWAQVNYLYASSIEQTRRKLEYDLYYIKNMSFFLDLNILLKTIRIVLFAQGI